MHKRLTSFITFILFLMSTVTNTQAQTDGHYATVNGIKMYYEIQGSGTPLVLIHGGGSTIHTNFAKIMPMLAKAHKIIAVELQAHGHTSDRGVPSSFEQDADDVAQLLKQLNITGADVLGFSNGGNTTMQLAVRHPERVRKLVLASTFYKREGMQSWFWGMMEHADISGMPQVYKDEYLRINPGNQAGLQTMHDRDARRMQTFTDWKDETLQSIKAPSLVVIGDQDVMRPEHAVVMAHLLPHARLAILPGNHGSYMGEIMTPDTGSKIPDLFIAMVEEFLAAPMPDLK